MNAINKASRVNTAMQVIQGMNDGINAIDESHTLPTYMKFTLNYLAKRLRFVIAQEGIVLYTDISVQVQDAPIICE